MRKSSSGFTIVELLIVIVVIAILATISIVAYRGIQDRANDSAVQSDLRNLANKLAIFKVDNDRFPSNVSELTAAGLKVSKSAYAVSPKTNFNFPYCTRSSSADFLILAKSQSENVYSVSNVDGVKDVTSVVTWDNTTGSGGGICNALGFGGAISHGYYSPDTTNGPWRSWINAS